MLSVTLTPMQLPPALETAGGTALGTPLDSTPSACRLRLSPGEPSELVVQVRNDENQPLAVQLRVGGDFPNQWCQVGQEGNSLPAGRQMDAVVQFAIPADYLEQQPLGPGETLKLTYSGQVVLEGRPQEGGNALWQSTTPFTLVVQPHSLYPRFLPALYREVDFIGRLLAIFEQTFEPAVQTMDTLWAHLDPLTAPTTLLPFLAHWVGWQALPQWPLADQRRLIRQAMEIYRFRGTRRGLCLYLHLYTGLPLPSADTPSAQQAIAIEEVFSRGFILGETALGQDAVLGGGRPFHFRVRLRPLLGHAIDETLVRTIIEQEKPAFCTYDLTVEPQVVQQSSVSAIAG
ncbi:phage tail protein [Leptolyngbya sp. PCC 6406]|uniref:phage tail protein n=1 Tax=Leptolyngbya sp. PCC 6406 TaxID=1173264 RepID=UPI0002AC8873|nr:phage tail protein [Leptolyngbya sp. PCC 6406]